MARYYPPLFRYRLLRARRRRWAEWAVGVALLAAWGRWFFGCEGK